MKTEINLEKEILKMVLKWLVKWYDNGVLAMQGNYDLGIMVGTWKTGTKTEAKIRSGIYRWTSFRKNYFWYQTEKQVKKIIKLLKKIFG